MIRTRTRSGAADARHQFFCSWGHHYVREGNYFGERFSKGTMCFLCQMEVLDELVRKLDLPELSVARQTLLRSRHADDAEKRKVEKRIKHDAVEGFVYYIRINGHIKIGYAKDVTKRMRHYPPGSDLLAVEPGTMTTEKERHAQFKPYLTRGNEWFVEADMLKRHIETIRDEYGNPANLAYQYTRR